MIADPQDFGNNALTVITFNYDRSLEYYFERVLSSRFHLGSEEARVLRESVPIIHVHGILGDLDTDTENYRSYGSSRDPQNIARSAGSIRIVHEGQDSNALERAREALAKAEIVCFLGFGFHPANVRRLAHTKSPEQFRNVYATTYMMGMNERARARALVRRHFRLPDAGNFHQLAFGPGEAPLPYDFETYDCLTYLRNAPVLEPIP